MKKVILGILALSAVSFAAAGDSAINLRVGGDLGAKWSKITDEDTNQTILSDKIDSLGGELAIEYIYSIDNNVSLGLGTSYQKHAYRKSQLSKFDNHLLNANGATYDSIPVYATAEYKFITKSGVNPYLKANLGYSFNIVSYDINTVGDNGVRENTETETDNGLYWALGGGVEYNNFTLDLMYAVTKAKSHAKDDSSDKDDNDYGRVVLSAGYRFNL